MADRSSQPQHSPGRTPAAVEEHIVRLRREHQLGPMRIAWRVPVAASTVYQVLRRRHMPPSAACDRATGDPIRHTGHRRICRYERAHPGELVHVDVKKPVRIPDGGGHKKFGRPPTRGNQARTR